MKQISTNLFSFSQERIIHVMNILKHIVEKYIVEHLKTFRVVLIEYIVVLYTLLCAGGKLSYNFLKN